MKKNIQSYPKNCRYSCPFFEMNDDVKRQGLEPFLLVFGMIAFLHVIS